MSGIKITKYYIGCSFKCILKVGVEESIVNAPLVSLQCKNTKNAKSEVSFKQLMHNCIIRGAFTINSSTPTLRINLIEQPILYDKGIKCIFSFLARVIAPPQ
jgi:hypothetical protein